MKNKINKRGQHEIAGFVLIIIVVMVMGLIFLAITLRQDNTPRRTSQEISDFLLASIYYTTDCAINNVPNYEDLQGLIKECYADNESECHDGTKICEALNTTLNNVIVNNLQIGYKNKAYELDIYFRRNRTTQRKDILRMSGGIFANCSSIIGSSDFIPSKSTGIEIGIIWMELDVCKS